MADPFKNVFNSTLIHHLAKHLAKAEASFHFDKFVTLAEDGLQQLELKGRSNQICRALQESLPKNYRKAVKALLNTLHPEDSAPLSQLKADDKGVRGWAIMPMAQYVAEGGAEDYDYAMHALAQMTCRFTAEFAVRKLINVDPARALPFIELWSQSSNEHVRRFASEGSRPRLPWGEKISAWVQDPRPILPVLERLKNDPSEYVRKSVANHLNDISKDHPQLLISTVSLWWPDASPALQRLIKHACRSLIKQGEVETLAFMGFSPLMWAHVKMNVEPKVVRLGETIELHFNGQLMSDMAQKVVVDYVLHFVLKSGKLGKKVYKWTSLVVQPDQKVSLKKSHSFKPITTRTYYPGRHTVEVQINGEIVASSSFQLRLE